MDLVQLRSFLKIAELGSFTRAAVECHLSQPALSQQISRLELEIGCPVFERLGRCVRLTEAGEILHGRAVRILALVDDTLKEVSDDGETGRLVVAAIPTIAPYFMPRVLSEFREHYPRARVELNELVTGVLVKRCLQGEIDIGVLALPVETTGLEVEPLHEETLWLVLPPGHALARGGGDVPLPILRDEPFVLLDEEHCLSDQIQGFCRSRNMQPLRTGRASQLATVQELVTLGHGLSFIPDMARRLDPSPQRTYRAIEGDPPQRTIAACWNPYRYQSKLTRGFLEILRCESGRMASG